MNTVCVCACVCVRNEVMILSRGKLAFSGRANRAIGYFESVGHPVPPRTNPVHVTLEFVFHTYSIIEPTPQRGAPVVITHIGHSRMSMVYVATYARCSKT